MRVHTVATRIMTRRPGGIAFCNTRCRWDGCGAVPTNLQHPHTTEHRRLRRRKASSSDGLCTLPFVESGSALSAQGKGILPISTIRLKFSRISLPERKPSPLKLISNLSRQGSPLLHRKMTRQRLCGHCGECEHISINSENSNTDTGKTNGISSNQVMRSHHPSSRCLLCARTQCHVGTVVCKMAKRRGSPRLQVSQKDQIRYPMQRKSCRWVLKPATGMENSPIAKDILNPLALLMAFHSCSICNLR